MSKKVYVKPYPKEFREQVVKLVQLGDRSAAGGGPGIRDFGGFDTALGAAGGARPGPPSGRPERSREGGVGASATRDPAATDGAGDPVKSSGLVCSGDRFDRVRAFEFVRVNQARYPIACMCRVLGVSPSGYYAWRGRPPSRRARENEALSRRITAIHAKSREIYGARRGHAELWAAGVAVSRQRVARLMRALGRQGVTRRRRRCTTWSVHLFVPRWDSVG